MPGWDRSLSISASLEPRAAGSRPHREADAAELCEGLSQAQQERRQRCGSGLRGGDAAVDAVCADEVRRAAIGLDVTSQPAAFGASAHDAVERHPRAYGRAWHHFGQGAQWNGRAAEGHCAHRRWSHSTNGTVLPRSACPPIRDRHNRGRCHRKRIHAWHRSCRESRRLEEIPGIGPIVATALVAEIGDWKQFRSGRNLAAWIGLVPKQHSTGGKERLGRITKQGNRYLRWLLVAGAMAVIRYARQHGTKRLWLTRIMARRPTKVAAVALANKIARMAWAIMARGERFAQPRLLPTAA